MYKKDYRFKTGQLVWWDDPAMGLCSDYYVIHSIRGEIILLTNKGSEVEAYRRELTHPEPRMLFKQHRTEVNDLTDWCGIKALPTDFPDGSTVSFYPNSLNLSYQLPDDRVRYYVLDNGGLCRHCMKIIDKAVEVHAEKWGDRTVNICSECWRAAVQGKLKLQTQYRGKPLYQLINSREF